MSLFRLDASIMPPTSATRALADLVEQEWTAAHPDASVIRRDIVADPVAAEVWHTSVSAAFTPEDQRTPAQLETQSVVTAIADQLINADALLFAVPLYNYGVSQHFKTWFDVAYNDPRIGPAGTALNGKPAVLVTALGGNYGPGMPKEGWDHSTPWLRRVLEDVWGLDLTVVQRPFTLVGVNPAMSHFAGEADALRTQAEDAARAAGRAIASTDDRAAA